MTIEGNPQIVFNFLKSFNILKFYVQNLASTDYKLVVDTLDNMYAILELGDKLKPMNEENPFVADLTHMGALTML